MRKAFIQTNPRPNPVSIYIYVRIHTNLIHAQYRVYDMNMMRLSIS